MKCALEQLPLFLFVLNTHVKIVQTFLALAALSSCFLHALQTCEDVLIKI